MAAKKNGAGCWVARRMVVDRPFREGETIEAIVVYNTATDAHQVHETLGVDLDKHFKENPDEIHSREELEEIYMDEAETWADDLNARGE